MSDGADSPRPGLRERKKARTEADIVRHAVRLFRERGYHQTTVDQIAEAAEVSRTTFFRYFGTKEDVALRDLYDPQFLDLLRALPPEMGPLAAIRAALSHFLAAVDGDELVEEWQRVEVILSVPELLGRLPAQSANTLVELEQLVAARMGRTAEDPDVHLLLGAVIGVIAYTWMRNLAVPALERLRLVERALGQLEASFPFGTPSE